MHLVEEASIDWMWRFGIRSGREFNKFQELATSPGASGSPVLSGAPAWVDCRVESRLPAGDRTIFLAEVIDAHLARPVTPLTIKRMLALAPPERMQEMRQAMERDIQLDRAAILAWQHSVAQ
jgi:flavin reductase (DIM6/NTAB) family NADH-FMN oxidoreductase RutF